jgi:hypothetical protein
MADVALVSPVAAHLTNITAMEFFAVTSGAQTGSDYTLRFRACNEVAFYFIHVKALATALQALYVPPYVMTNEYVIGDTRYRLTGKNVLLAVAAGEEIGRVRNTFDFGAFDSRVPALAYANPSRWYSSPDGIDQLHHVCPLGLYETGAVKSQLEAVLGDVGQPRTVTPICGEIMQDLPGTLQGNWYHDSSGATEDYGRQLAFVHDNMNPAIAALSVGGTIMTATAVTFAPTHSGTQSREFAEVTADGNTYCYPIPSGRRLLVRMTSATRIQVEVQAGDCTSPAAFVSPFEFIR